MIPGAVWRDPEQVGKWVDDLAQDSKTVLYCIRGGAVSQSVRATLLKKGIAAAVAGGLKAWTDHGEPLA